MNLDRTCEACQGTGIAETSNCCDAPYDNDYMICSDCHEHLGDQTCIECDGTGKVLFHIDTQEDY